MMGRMPKSKAFGYAREGSEPGGSGKGDDAVKIIQKVIQDADPQQKELHARAYNALGIATKNRSRLRMRCSPFCAGCRLQHVPEAAC